MNQISLKKICEKIKKLNVEEKYNILDFCKNNNIPFSKNTNGYFFNFTDTTENLLLELNNLINIIQINKDKIKEAELERLKNENLLKEILEKKNKTQEILKTQELKKLIIKQESINLNLKPIYNIRFSNETKFFNLSEQEWNIKMK